MPQNDSKHDNKIDYNPSAGDHILDHEPKHSGSSAGPKEHSGTPAGQQVNKAATNKISSDD